MMNLGEYMYGHFQEAFLHLDEESEHALSGAKTRRERKKWAGDEFCLQIKFAFGSIVCVCVRVSCSYVPRA